MHSIYHVSFPNQYLLTSTMLRFEEHYESPKFKDKIFTLEEYADWYAEENGNFTYYQDWNGFNIPGSYFDLFIEGRFNPLTKKEEKFLGKLNAISEEKFYVIATAKDSRSLALEHEIVHGLFNLYPSYASDVLVDITIASTDGDYDTNDIQNALADVGYHYDVFRDELNAYALTGIVPFLEDTNIAKFTPLLLTTFEKHFGKYDVKTLHESIHTIEW